MLGTWRVDLRPAPGAAEYFVELEVTEADGQRVQGRFYETPMRHGCVNSDWGALRFSFVTEDGSGAYNTSVLLRPDGTLAGTTHSLGRDFLSVWTAERLGE